MLESGYVRLYRSFLNWEWYNDANTMRVFLHLILTANWEPKKWRGITIERGQRVYSSQKLAAELHVSRQMVRTALNHLISTGEIANKSTPEYSVVTIKNYDSYQQLTNESTNEQPTPNQRATNEQPQLKKDKKSNKDKKDKKDICADAFTHMPYERSTRHVIFICLLPIQILKKRKCILSHPKMRCRLQYLLERIHPSIANILTGTT